MKLQLGTQGTSLVVFSGRDVAGFDHYTRVQAIRVVNVGVTEAEVASALGVLFSRGGEPVFGIRVHRRMEIVAPAIHMEPPLVVLAYDDRLIAIDVERQDLTFEISLNSPFREVIEIPGTTFLVCSEADVEAFDTKWKRRWRYSGDLIEECRVEGETLLVRFMDRAPERLSLESGKPG
jgi:hypothetical protein